MSIRAHSAGILAVIFMTAGAIQSAHSEPLRIRYAVWPGYGPLFFAKEKGWFEKERIEIELIEMEEHTAAFAGLATGQVDAVLGAPPDAAAFSKPGEEPLACVLVTEESFGGDGVLATTDIRSIADLQGKSVAFLRGSLSQYYINVLLKEAGLTEADIEVVDLTAEDAVTALQLQEVDAAVTWQPWLTQDRAVEHVHLLTDNSQQPGLLVGCLITTASVFQDRKAEFQALARIWFEAVDDVEAHPEKPYRSWLNTWAAGRTIRRRSPSRSKRSASSTVKNTRLISGRRSTPVRCTRLRSTPLTCSRTWAC
jgi:NitT/TauT family transport system substrate-binding protein